MKRAIADSVLMIGMIVAVLIVYGLAAAAEKSFPRCGFCFRPWAFWDRAHTPACRRCAREMDDKIADIIRPMDTKRYARRAHR